MKDLNDSRIQEKDHQTVTECSAQREEMYRHIAEICDRETRESVHEWHRHRQKNLESKIQNEEDKSLCSLDSKLTTNH
jgi:hypothetical protein